MKVLPNELENQPEFDGFTEWLQTFELYRGKQGVEEFEDEGRVVGKFKVRFLFTIKGYTEVDLLLKVRFLALFKGSTSFLFTTIYFYLVCSLIDGLKSVHCKILPHENCRDWECGGPAVKICTIYGKGL